MRNVSDADVATAKQSSISVAAAQKLKAPEGSGGVGDASSNNAG